MKRARNIWVAIGVAVWATTLSGVQLGPDSARPSWVATWSAAPQASAPNGALPRAFANETIRQIVRISAGGRYLRVRFSNAFGAGPVRLGAAHIAMRAEEASIVPGSDRTLTFGGQPSITVPQGAVVTSDPVALMVPSHAELAVSLYLPENTGPATFHFLGNQTSYISSPGDFTGVTSLPVAETTLSRFFVTVVEALPRQKIGTVAVIGDSITDGGDSTPNTNRRWPDFLSARLNSPSRPRMGVANQGIGCGRLLLDFCGPNGASRFDRDVLTVTGVTHVIVALGLVDIILPTSFGRPDEITSADEIIAGMRQLIERAHARGLTIYGATLTPVGRSPFSGVFTPENEAKRQAVNHWMRSSGAFDAVIDFDRAIRDPAKPTHMLAIYSSPGGVHSNDAGYEAMAASIDLRLFH